MGCLHTEDLKRAILFHKPVFISQEHLVTFHIGKKGNARKAKNKISIPFILFYRIVLAKNKKKANAKK